MMDFLDVLDFSVNYVTARDVLALKGLREDVPNVVLRHDYDSLRNWIACMHIEEKQGVVSSNYLLMNSYRFTHTLRHILKEYEENGFEFGLHQSFMDSKKVATEILTFQNLGLKLTTMTPHGWADKDGEYPSFSNWEVDRFHGDGKPISMNCFYEFCHKHFGPYDLTYDIARYYSPSGKSFFEFPYRGILVLDDSGNFFKPYTPETVMEHLENGKVYVFLFHPSNMDKKLRFIQRKMEDVPWMSRMEWDHKFKH